MIHKTTDKKRAYQKEYNRTHKKQRNAWRIANKGKWDDYQRRYHAAVWKLGVMAWKDLSKEEKRRRIQDAN